MKIMENQSKSMKIIENHWTSMKINRFGTARNPLEKIFENHMKKKNLKQTKSIHLENLIICGRGGYILAIRNTKRKQALIKAKENQ